MKRIFILSLIFTILATGCSMNYHLNKAIKKGYKPPVYDTIRINTVDSFPVIVRDSIVWEKYITQKDTVIQIQKQYVPKTRIIQRFDLKRFNDSLEHIRTIYSDSLKYALKTKKTTLKTDLKQVKSENKNTFADAMRWIFFSLLLIALFFVVRAVRRYLLING
jgi:hypothetical protein